MNSTKIQLLLWSGCLGAVILFAKDEQKGCSK